VKAAQPFSHRFIDDTVVGNGGLPTHPADQADGSHEDSYMASDARRRGSGRERAFLSHVEGELNARNTRSPVCRLRDYFTLKPIEAVMGPRVARGAANTMSRTTRHLLTRKIPPLDVVL
jgi:hypothetical protein